MKAPSSGSISLRGRPVSRPSWPRMPLPVTASPISAAQGRVGESGTRRQCGCTEEALGRHWLNQVGSCAFVLPAALTRRLQAPPALVLTRGKAQLRHAAHKQLVLLGELAKAGDAEELQRSVEGRGRIEWDRLAQAGGQALWCRRPRLALHIGAPAGKHASL